MAGDKTVRQAGAGHLEGSQPGGSHLGGMYSTATVIYQSHRHANEAKQRGTDIGVVRQRIRVSCREIFWVFDVF